MINFVCNFELIVTVQCEKNGRRVVRNLSVNWPVLRFMMQPCMMFVFQITKYSLMQS